jgi:CheY-like chemotaxis protein
VSQPLALILYEKMTPGSLLVNRLQDASYRVHALTNPAELAPVARSEKPLLIFADLENTAGSVLGAITELRQHPETSHVPVVAMVDEATDAGVTAAREAGATLTVTDAGVLAHLPQVLEQSLRIE